MGDATSLSARWLAAGFFDKALSASLFFTISPRPSTALLLFLLPQFTFTFFLGPLRVFHPAHKKLEMDNWRVAVLGDGGVGKTALAVQVRPHLLPRSPSMIPTPHQFTLNCFVGQLIFL